MCIETAIELTSNNRVAAAELLGLSRQSFYVRLRKYDLLKKVTTDVQTAAAKNIGYLIRRTPAPS